MLRRKKDIHLHLLKVFFAYLFSAVLLLSLSHTHKHIEKKNSHTYCIGRFQVSAAQESWGTEELPKRREMRRKRRDSHSSLNRSRDKSMSMEVRYNTTQREFIDNSKTKFKHRTNSTRRESFATICSERFNRPRRPRLWWKYIVKMM